MITSISSESGAEPRPNLANSGRNRGGQFTQGHTGIGGRPRGFLSRRSLRELRKQGIDGELVADRMVRSIIQRATGMDKDGKVDPRHADLAAFELLHNIVDGPIAKDAPANDSGNVGAQVIVMVENIGTKQSDKL